MSPAQSDRTLREAADFLLDVARLQPKFHQRAMTLSTELRRTEQEHREALSRYSREWAAARKEQEALRASVAALQDTLKKTRADLRAAQAEADRATRTIQQGLARPQAQPAVLVAAVPSPVPDPEVELLRRRLEHLQRKVNRPRFWSGAFAETFAESLAGMDAVHQALEVDSAAEVTAVFRAWQQEIVDGIELLGAVGFDDDLAEHLRRLLICQWVYLRWQEVTS